MQDDFEPLIVSFCCNWCSYAGADLAGVSRLQYPPNIRIIRVMCSGMVHPNFYFAAQINIPQEFHCIDYSFRIFIWDFHL